MIDESDCGAIGGMKIGRGNRSTRRKPRVTKWPNFNIVLSQGIGRPNERK
jgi:hypothetical protein